MKALPWWLVSLISAAAAVLIVFVALLSPSPWGWICIGVGVSVFLVVLFNNPLYWYRRLAGFLAGTWLSLTAASGLSALIRISDGSVAFLLLENVGMIFHVVVGLVLVVLLILDYFSTSDALQQLSNQAEEAKRDGAQRSDEFFEGLPGEWKGKLALQIAQAHSVFIGIDPTDLTKKDRGLVAITQVEAKKGEILAKERIKLITAGGVITILMACIAYAFYFTKLRFEDRPAVERPVAIHLTGGGGMFRENVDLIIRYGSEQRSVRVEHGTAHFAVPGHVSEISSIEADDPSYLIVDSGPHAIEAGRAIELEVAVQAEVPPPTPDDFPDPRTAIPPSDLPDRNTVLNQIAAVNPTDAVLTYLNKTDATLDLALFDCSAYYTGGNPWFVILPADRGAVPSSWGNFEPPSTGWFCFFSRRRGVGAFRYLACENLFLSSEMKLGHSSNRQQRCGFG